MKIALGSKHVLEVFGTCDINGVSYYKCWFNGGEYQVEKYAHQYAGVKSLNCEYTGLHSDRNLTFKQDMTVVLSEIYKKDKVYSFVVKSDYIDRYGKMCFKLKDNYDFSHTVKLDVHNFNVKKVESVICKVDNIVNGKLVLSFCSVVKFCSPKKLDFRELDFKADGTLRDYQIENKRKIYDAWSKYNRVMLQMPTGTGKTRLFVSIVKDLHNWGAEHKRAIKVLILAHRKELIEQISNNVGYKYGLAHGLIVSQNQENKLYPVQVGSVPTLSRRLERWDDKVFDVIIVDEAHHVKAASYKNILQQYPNAKVLGVTATPYRLNGAGFIPEFEDLIISPSVSEFIKRGYLCEYDYYSIKEDSSLQREIDRMQLNLDGDYMDSEMMDVMDRDSIRAGIVETYLKYAKGRKGIVYTVNKNHNNHICNKFVEHGVRAVAIDSDTPKEKRDELVGKFREGEIDVLCNVNIFSEGFDCPDVEFIQLARPTKSLSMFLQQVGRGLRIAEDKDRVVILDNVGLYNKFGFPSARRKWKYHFEGRKDVDELEEPRYEVGDEMRTVYDIEEGNDVVDLVHSSENEIVEVEDDMKKDVDYKQLFVSYLLHQGFWKDYISECVHSLKKYVDTHIRAIIDQGYKGVFYSIDLEKTQNYFNILRFNSDFLRLTNLNKNILISMEHYLSFLEQLWKNKGKEEINSIEENKEVVNLIDNIEYMHLDNFERGFKANFRYIQSLIKEEIPFIIKWMQMFNFKEQDLRIEYLLDNLPERRIAMTNLGVKIFCFIKKYSPELDLELLEKFIEDGVEYCKILQLKFTPQQFLELFEDAKINELKNKGDLAEVNRLQQINKSEENIIVEENIIENNSIGESVQEIDGVDKMIAYFKQYSIPVPSELLERRKLLLLNDKKRIFNDIRVCIEQKIRGNNILVNSFYFTYTKADNFISFCPINKDVTISDLKGLDDSIELLKKLGLNIPKEILNKQEELQTRMVFCDKLANLKDYLLLNFKGYENIDEISFSQCILKVKYDSGEILEEKITLKYVEKESKKEYEKVDNSKSIRKKLKVTFSDGRIVCLDKSKYTLVETIKMIGVADVRKLNLMCNGIPLIDDKLDSLYRKAQVEVENGLYINTCTDTETKAAQIKRIATQLGIDIKVELVDKSPKEIFVVESKDGDSQLGGRKSFCKLRVVLPDGRILAGNTVADTLQEVVEYVGVENVMKMNIIACGIPLVSAILDVKYGKYQRKLSNGMFLMTNTPTERKIKQIQQISDAYSLGLKIETM